MDEMHRGVQDRAALLMVTILRAVLGLGASVWVLNLAVVWGRAVMQMGLTRKVVPDGVVQAILKVEMGWVVMG
jgi:hypothetical protein